MSKILDTLGRKIFEYFVSRTSPGEEFVLCIDTYTYELCAAECGFSEKEIDDLLDGKNIRSGAYSYYAALAVAALEVKIAFDIETDKVLQDSYNRRLLKLRLANFSNENDVQTFYSYYQDKIRYQDKIWRYSKALFKTKERNLIIPNPKAGPGRYVQYPLYPRNELELSGKNIIKFADTFISLGLEPGQALTYEYFCKKVFINDYGEITRRMIFSFYCLWDGRTFEEIYNKRNYSIRERALQIEKKQIFVQLAPEIKIYINEIQIDLNKTIIDDKFLWKFYEYRFSSENFSYQKGYVFIKDNDYQDWMPCHGSVEPDEELLIITAYCNFPSYINALIESGEITVYKNGQYKFLLLNINNKEQFEKFGIKLKKPPLISLIGGLKCKRNTYYPFALPTIKVNEEIYGNNYIKKIFIDGREYPLIDNKCKIPHNLSNGKHSIKLNNSWESSEQKFYIEDIPANLNLEQHGWNINYFQSILEPAKDISDIVVDNITLQSELKWTEHNAVSSIMPEEKGLRGFLQRKNQLESRFSRIGNIRLDKRGKYGK